MNDQATIRRVPSALSQAGVDDAVFRSGTLRIEERPGTALVRLHSIGDLHDSASTLIDLPVTILEEYGIARPAPMTGRDVIGSRSGAATTAP